MTIKTALSASKLLGITTLFLSIVLPEVAKAQAVIPDVLKVPDGQQLLLKTSAEGVQIYDCKASTTDVNSFSYVFREPRADLFNESGQKIISHGRGPSWKFLEDGSTIIASMLARSTSPNPNSIPELSLQVNEKQGEGFFSNVNFIQRLDTVGGLAPSGLCNPIEVPTVEVPYTSNYFFSGISPKSVPEETSTMGLFVFALFSTVSLKIRNMD
jgi:Protein of unknown function (DUF3455)